MSGGTFCYSVSLDALRQEFRETCEFLAIVTRAPRSIPGEVFFAFTSRVFGPYEMHLERLSPHLETAKSHRASTCSRVINNKRILCDTVAI